MDELFEVMPENPRAHPYPHPHAHHKGKPVSTSEKFDFVKIRNEPVFVEVREGRFCQGDLDSSDVMFGWPDIVRIPEVEEESEPNNWMLFDKPLPSLERDDDLFQRELPSKIKMTEMLYPFLGGSDEQTTGF